MRKGVKKSAYYNYMLINEPPSTHTQLTNPLRTIRTPLASRTECREAAWSSAGGT